MKRILMFTLAMSSICAYSQQSSKLIKGSGQIVEALSQCPVEFSGFMANAAWVKPVKVSKSVEKQVVGSRSIPQTITTKTITMTSMSNGSFGRASKEVATLMLTKVSNSLVACDSARCFKFQCQLVKH